jgi:uncharacterized protein with von Willebrand factor type A (vWA) domain
MLSIMELKKQQTVDAKRAAERRKQIATQQRRIKLALKKVGAIITPGLWAAPDEVRAWVKSEVNKVLNKTETQRKQAKEIIEGLDDYAVNKKYEDEKKSVASAKKKAPPTASSSSGPAEPRSQQGLSTI